MYGSSFNSVTFMPRASSNAANDAEAIPFPNDETTPPVMKIKRVVIGVTMPEGEVFGMGGKINRSCTIASSAKDF